jgi:hypothetical protein
MYSHQVEEMNTAGLIAPPISHLKANKNIEALNELCGSKGEKTFLFGYSS